MAIIAEYDDFWNRTFHEFQKALIGFYCHPKDSAQRMLWAYIAHPEATLQALRFNPQRFGAMFPDIRCQDMNALADTIMHQHDVTLPRAAADLQLLSTTTRKLAGLNHKHPTIAAPLITADRDRRDKSFHKFLAFFNEAVGGDWLDLDRLPPAPAATLNTLKPTKRKRRDRERLP